MKSLLPVILVILLLTGAIVFSLTKNTITKIIPKQFGIPATELQIEPITPTPTPTITVTPITDKLTNRQTDKLVIVPTLTAKKTVSPTKGGQTVSTIDNLRSTQLGTPCTPVYGMANTCTEHIVVDTAGESDLFFSFAGLSYLAGLLAFVKSKYA